MPVSEDRSRSSASPPRATGSPPPAATSRSPHRATCVLADGTVTPGPHHATPPCRHFPSCGGCQLQHLDEEALAGFVARPGGECGRGAGAGAELRRAAPHLSPPRSRRRATLHAASVGGQVAVGFREARLAPDRRHARMPRPRARTVRAGRAAAQRCWRTAGQADRGRCRAGAGRAGRRLSGIKGLTVEGLAATEAMLDFARDHGLARLTLDQGFGPEALWEPEPVTRRRSAGVPRSAAARRLPPGHGRRRGGAGRGGARMAGGRATRRRPVLRARHLRLRAGAGRHEGARRRGRARRAPCLQEPPRRRAGVPVHALHRDLFRNPLQPDELNRVRRAWCSIRRAPARASRSTLLAAQHRAADRLHQLQPVELGARRGDAGGGRLPARRAASGRPVPLVHPRRAGEPVRALAFGR